MLRYLQNTVMNGLPSMILCVKKSPGASKKMWPNPIHSSPTLKIVLFPYPWHSHPHSSRWLKHVVTPKNSGQALNWRKMLSIKCLCWKCKIPSYSNYTRIHRILAKCPILIFGDGPISCSFQIPKWFYQTFTSNPPEMVNNNKKSSSSCNGLLMESGI